MPISVVFDPPLPSDSPSTFNTKAFTLLGDLNDWSTQANALPGEVATNLSALLASPPAIGSTTPAAVSATTLSASGASGAAYATFNAPTNGGYQAIQVGGVTKGYVGSYPSIIGGGSANDIAIATVAGGSLFLGGDGATTGIKVVTNTGAVTIPGSVTIGGTVTANLLHSTSAALAEVRLRGAGGSDWEILTGDGSSSGADTTLGFFAAGAYRLKITNAGAVTIPGSTSFTGGTFGYGIGAGGTVTQATSKSTDVTLNKPCGQITMNNAALAAGDLISFYLFNNHLSVASGFVVTGCNDGVVNPSSYKIEATSIVNGDRVLVSVTNRTGGSLSEALVFNFQVISGATS